MKFFISKNWIVRKAALESDCNVEAGSPPVLLAPVDLDKLVLPGYNLMINRRKDGSWGITLVNGNPRHRKPPIRAQGLTLEDALINLCQQPRT